MKTAHQWAVELTHECISYGEFLEAQPDVLAALKKAIFNASRRLIAEVQQDAASSPSKSTTSHT